MALPPPRSVAPHVTVRVPGTTSNLGSGFDFLGMAVERWLQVLARCVDDRSAPAIALERRGTLSDLGVAPDQDLIYRGFAAACRVAGRDVPGRLAFTADSDIPVSRGLGSSAAAVVAGAAAANTLLDLRLGPEALLALCAEIEGHPDNVAPAVYGGACLVLHRSPSAGGWLTVPIEIHPALAFVFAVPDLRVETKRARAALPATVPHATAVQAAARGAALIHGLVTADPDSLAVGLDDLLHVPYRRSLVAGYDAVTASARAAGAYGATLSGSGPTLVAATTPARASAVGKAMIGAWREIDVNAEALVVSRRVNGYDA
jgi:homoserine kinase